jgi:hypothetical protein
LVEATALARRGSISIAINSRPRTNRKGRFLIYSVEKLNSCALGILPMNRFVAEN